MKAGSLLRGFLFLALQFSSISSNAGNSIRVDEQQTRLTFNEKDARLSLAVTADFARDVPVRVHLEFVDPTDTVWKEISQDSILTRGSKRVDLTLPELSSRMKDRLDQRGVWTRIRYRLTVDPNGHNAIETHGVVSISEISAQAFVLSISQPFEVVAGSRCRIYVFTQQPGTKLGVPNVDVMGKLTISDDSEDRTLEASSRTNSTGVATLDFDIPPNLQDPDIAINVVANLAGFVRETTEDIEFSSQTELVVTSDKPLYQPGQYLRFRVLAFGASHRPLKNIPLQLSIKDPESATAFRTDSMTSEYGEAHAEWRIPDNARLGDYEISVERQDKNFTVDRPVKISRYELPAFTVNPKPDRPYYLPNQSAKVEVRADYLFGQPVKQGHVRVVRESEHRWNFREQKWDIEEERVVEGELDASGRFVASVDLKKDQDGLARDSYQRYEDLEFCAYVTDSTSNRTEQRRFDVRITKEPIHIYVNENGNGKDLPIEVYISTFYADGKPAKTSVAIYDAANPEQPLRTISTNRYGVAKVKDLRSNAAELRLLAQDGRSATGHYHSYINRREEATRVYTNRTVYRRGEPIEIEVRSTHASGPVILEVRQEDKIFFSKIVQLHNGKTFDIVRSNAEFKDDISVRASYVGGTREEALRTIVFPRDRELKIETTFDRTSYSPGQAGSISFRVRGPDSLPQPSLLGVVMLDKAIEERARTDKEFGQDDWFCFRCFEDRRAGTVLSSLSRRDLDRLDLTLPIDDDIDVAADVLLNSGSSSTSFSYIKDDAAADAVFHLDAQRQLAPLKRALEARFALDRQYPVDEDSLYTLLLDQGIDLKTVRDPWDEPYHTHFSTIRSLQGVDFISSGPDKRFGTTDDFHVLRVNWQYFQAHKDAIDKAIESYHARTDDYIRDETTLKSELSASGQDFDSWIDPWGHPYQLQFAVRNTLYTIDVRSGGPNGRFDTEEPVWRTDDFVVGTSSIDYGWKVRNALDQIVSWFYERSKTFPNDEAQFEEAKKGAGISESALLDPWKHRYTPFFRMRDLYTDRLKITANAVGTDAKHTEATPVTDKIEIVGLRSAGPDGIEGTPDDFEVANVSRVLSERFSRFEESQTDAGTPVLQGSNGAIRGFVTDASGAVVPGVTVVVTSMTREADRWTTVTDASGNYVFRNLLPGAYTVSFSLPGFTTRTIQQVSVRPYVSTEVTITLEVGRVSQMVSLAAEVATSNNLSVEAAISVVNKPELKQVSAMSTPRLREYFPETLFWEPAIETDRSGRARIPFKLADNITTWKMSAIVSTTDGQIARIDKEILAFQPFFIDHDPPKTLTEGDEIALPVLVRNYLEKDQTVELAMNPQDWFSSGEASTRKINIKSGQTDREIFSFRAVKPIHDAPHRITAKGTRASDAIEKRVAIHPDGKEVTNVSSDIVRTGATHTVTMPSDMIPNTMRAEVRIYPNLISHVIDGIEGILQRPYGCAEQTISSAYPSLMLLRFYEKNGNGSAAVADKARRYLRLGLDRLWAYQTGSGGFSYWGNETADIAVTAYALRFLNDARHVVPVDEDAFRDAYTWLARQQQADGSWTPSNTYRSMSISEITSLTSLVTRVLSLPEIHESPSEVKRDSLNDALTYLRKRIDEFEDPYTTASLAIAAQNAGDTALAEILLGRLERGARNDRSGTYWDLQFNTPFYGWGLAGRIETTALAVQALGAAQQAHFGPLADQGLLFLLRNKDRFGVWQSTQATVNALDALLILAAKANASETSGPAYIVVNGQSVATINSSGPVLQDISSYLNRDINQVEIRGSFAAAASAEFSESYYVPWNTYRDPVTADAAALSLTVHFEKTEAAVGDEIVADVHAERVGFRGYGMMLAEIGLPPGVEVDRASLDEAIKEGSWDLYRYDVLPDRLIAYVWPRAGGTDFKFKFRSRYGINAQTAESTLYDYYNPDALVTVQPVRFNVR